MKFRTDLAIERKELLDEESGGKDHDGIWMKKISYGSNVGCTIIKITDENGSSKLGKPVGTYITLEVEGLPDSDDGIKEDAERALAEELSHMIPFDPQLKILVVGLGNSEVTPDALGPATAAKVTVTRHMFMMLGATWDDRWSNVSCVTPGVTGTTGIETAELVKGAVDITRPDAVIIVDSLASRSIERVSTTIQLNDTGIEPGSGMGNVRKALNKDYLGCNVVAIGVPTVIDAATIIRDALEAHMTEAEQVDRYIEQHHREMIVTSTDIDQLIKDFSDIIANGINKTLHPGIYS